MKIKPLFSAHKDFLKDNFVRYGELLSFFFFLALISVLRWALFPEIKMQASIPLHYNIHFGIDWYGEWWRIFTVPLIGLIIFIANYLLAMIVWKEDKIMAYILVGAAVFSEFILFIAMIFIILLNLAYI